MKRVLVLTSVNDSLEYTSAINGARKCWTSIFNSAICFDFKVIHVNKGNNLSLSNATHFVEEFYVPQHIHSVFASQMSRLLFADQFDYDGILLTDVDILPVDPWYFIEPIISSDTSKFLVFRDVINDENQYPICYLYASPSVWGKILGEGRPAERLSSHWLKVKDSYSPNRGTLTWTYDQRWIYRQLNSTRDFLSLLSFPYPQDQTFTRLDRVRKSSRISWIAIFMNRYSDYHRKLPVTKFGQLTSNIVAFRIYLRLKFKHD